MGHFQACYFPPFCSNDPPLEAPVPCLRRWLLLHRAADSGEDVGLACGVAPQRAKEGQNTTNINKPIYFLYLFVSLLSRP